ncbi:MAG: hypothetical protein ACE5LU_09745 [Anaerolineae bacterium]
MTLVLAIVAHNGPAGKIVTGVPSRRIDWRLRPADAEMPSHALLVRAGTDSQAVA